jgi:hypothetical protein
MFKFNFIHEQIIPPAHTPLNPFSLGKSAETTTSTVCGNMYGSTEVPPQANRRSGVQVSQKSCR